MFSKLLTLFKFKSYYCLNLYKTIKLFDYSILRSLKNFPKNNILNIDKYIITQIKKNFK